MGSFGPAVGVFDNAGLCIKPRDKPFNVVGADVSLNEFVIADLVASLSSTARPNVGVVTAVATVVVMSEG